MKFNFAKEIYKQLILNNKIFRRKQQRVVISLFLVVALLATNISMLTSGIVAQENQLSDKSISVNSAVEPVDFEQYITSVTVKKEVDGKYMDFTEFYDGDRVQVGLVYSMPMGKLKDGQNLISYQLPVGIKLDAELSGDVIISGEAYGVYTIDKNGLVIITFTDPDFDYTNAFVGTVTFEGEIDASKLGQGEKIEFNSNNKFDVIQKEVPTNYDITGSKKQTTKVSDSYNYEIQIDSKNGSGEKISIDDKFLTNSSGAQNASYNQNSFVITKVSADKKETTINKSNYLTVNNNSNASSFSIDNLPALAKGECYKINYSATPTGVKHESKDGSSNLSNSVVVGSGGNRFTDSTKTVVDEPIEDMYDISGTKAETSNSDGSVDYKITVNSTLGTGDKVVIKDNFDTSSAGKEDADYNINSFKITMSNSKTGKTETIDASKYLTVDNTAVPSNFILKLPKLDANSKYNVSYKATPTGAVTELADGSSTLVNKVEVTSAEDKFTKTTTTKVQEKVLQKEGTFNSTTGIVDWKITLTPGQTNLKGFELSDEITTETGEKIKITTAKIKDTTTGKILDIELPYILGADFNQNNTYEITYSTNVFDIVQANKNTFVNNIGKLSKNDKTYTAEKNIPNIHKTTYELEKVSSSVDKENGIYGWTSSIVIPSKAEDITTDLEYKDTIERLVNPNEYLDMSHYITVGLLKDMLKTVNGKDLSSTNYNIIATTSNYQIIKDLTSVDDNTKLRNYTIIFNKEFLLEHLGQTIKLEYNTYVDVDKAKYGSEYLVRNIAEVGSKKVTVDVPYRKGKGISKYASVDGNNYYEQFPNAVEYSTLYNEEKKSAILNYRITFTTNMYNEIPDYMEDILPKGTTFDESTYKVKFKINEYWVTENAYLNGKNRFAKDYISYEILDGKVRFNIDDRFLQECGQENQTLDFYIYYSLLLPKASSWEHYEENTFVNGLTCGSDTVENKLKVQNSDGYLTKAGEQEQKIDANGNVVCGSDGKPLYENSATYTLEVNKANAKLSTTSTHIELLDTMSLFDLGGSYAELDRSSFKVYYYEENAVDHKGKLLTDNYSYTTSSNKTDKGIDYSIKILVPDKQAFVIEYTYDIIYADSAIKNLQLMNKAQIKGVDSVQEQSKVQMLKTTSSATVVQKSLTIYKYEEGKENKALPGATFLFEEYKDKKWIDTVLGTKTTDEKGMIYFDLYDDYFQIIYKENVLYRMTETIAPQGYAPLEKPVYFIWVKEGDTISDTLASVKLPSGVTPEEITFITDDEVTLLISNEQSSLSFKKQWVDQNYNVITPLVNEINVTIYQQKTELSNSHTVTVNSVANGTNSSGDAEENVQKKIIVDNNSKLVISVIDTKDVRQKFTVNGGTPKWGTTSPSSENVVSYVINKVTSDMNITITNTSQGKTYDFYFFDYTEPKYIPVGEKVEYKNITLDKAEDWKKTFSIVNNVTDSNTQLPKKDKKTGCKYFYSVEETNLLDGFTVSYSDNNKTGINLGEIVITNQKSGYELPQTGSASLLMCKAIGILLILMPLTILLYKKLKEKRWTTRLKM